MSADVVVLVGLPGSGKSTVARYLSALAHLDLIDVGALLAQDLRMASLPRAEIGRAFLERHDVERIANLVTDTIVSRSVEAGREPRAVVDAIRFATSIDQLRQTFPALTLLHVSASRTHRLARLADRFSELAEPDRQRQLELYGQYDVEAEKLAGAADVRVENDTTREILLENVGNFARTRGLST